MKKQKIYLYPLWVRLWHLLNALLIISLVISGLLIQNIDFTEELIPFESVIYIHNLSGVCFLFFFIVFVFGNIFSKNGKHYRIKGKGFYQRALKQFKYYSFGIFKKEQSPFKPTKDNKFNPLQKLTYLVILCLIIPLVILTGLLLLFPEYIPDNFLGENSLQITDLIHIIMGFIISMFLIIHVYLCTLSENPLDNFKSIINGWH